VNINKRHRLIDVLATEYEIWLNELTDKEINTIVKNNTFTLEQIELRELDPR